MRTITSVQERIEQMESQLADLKAVVQEQAEADAQRHSGFDLNSDPEVREAAVNLARAIARAKGVDMPMQAASGDFGNLPIMTLPDEFAKYGGIGIGVMYAPPTQAAREA